MTPYKIVYHGMHGTTKVLVETHKELVARGVVDPQANFILFNRYWSRFVTRGFPDARLLFHPSIIDIRSAAKRDYPSSSYSYSEDQFLRAWKMDRVLNKKPKSYAYQVWTASLARIERFLTEVQPDLILSEAIQSLLCYALFTVATAKRIPYIQLMASRLNSHRLEFCTDLSDHPYKTHSQLPSDTSLHWANQYVQEFKTRCLEPAYFADTKNKRIRFKWDDVTKSMTYLHELALGGALEPTRGNLIGPFISKLKAFRMERLLKKSTYYKTLSDLSQRPERKLLFPMHVTPEASTLTYTPQYADMGDSITGLSRHLPKGWILVAKEHPSVTSLLRSTLEIRRIRALDNVVLLSPYVDNRELLKICAAVITIKGTFGLETLLMGRAVITIGRPFYDETGNTVICRSLAELPQALEQAASMQVNPERTLQFLAAYYDSTGPGFFANPDIFIRDPAAALSHATIGRIADYIQDYVLARLPDLRAAIQKDSFVAI